MKQLQLITALGTNTDLVLQLIDFLNDNPKYRYNDEANRVRQSFSGRKITDLHLVVTTAVGATEKSLRKQMASEYPDVHIHSVPLPCDDIACIQDDETMRQLIYEQVKNLAAQNLIIASAGRKTITNRLIEAGMIYGCLGYLTLTAPKDMEQREYTESFHALWTPTRSFLAERQQSWIKDELGKNFQSLYLLPLTILGKLRDEKIGLAATEDATDRQWLHKLPKADLHCHLGGAYDARLLKVMAAALLDDCQITLDQRAQIRRHLETTTGCPLAELSAEKLRALLPEDQPKKHCLTSLEGLRPPDCPRHIHNAVLVDALSAEQLDSLSRDGHTSPKSWPKDLDWYMACGDFGGSALLQTERNLRLALSWLMTQARLENIRMLEVRFSPDNYTKGELKIADVIHCLRHEAQRFMDQNHDLQVNFLITATRHKTREELTNHIEAAVEFGQPGSGKGPRVTGFDLAGQEQDYDPESFKDIFLPLHRHFMNITIHAGEMEGDDKIWQAIYALHAKRIGHGLKLINNAKMMAYFRDHNIAIEMCPSSNCQTNSFKTNDGQGDGLPYPLKHYFAEGLAVTVSTDNRGISATTLTDEYLLAAKLSEGGLSKWDALRIIKNGFKAAFLPKKEKDKLLKDIDRQVFEIILDEYFPEGA